MSAALCPRCDGSCVVAVTHRGQIVRDEYHQPVETPCPQCGGTGRA